MAGGLFVDYLVRGRYHLIPKHPELLGPDNLAALTGSGGPDENPESAQISIQVQAPRAAEDGFVEIPASSANFDLKEMTPAHER